MKVGIGYNPLSNVSLHTLLVLNEIYIKSGHSVIFINTGDYEEYWPKSLHIPSAEYLHISDIFNLDLLVDIDGSVHPSTRKKVANKNIVFLTTTIQFTELDRSVYIQDSKYRNFNNADEIWVWDILNTEESLDLLRVLYNCPIKRVPFTWSPKFLELHKNIHYQEKNTTNKWNIYVKENNTENTSSCILPLVAIREIENKKLISASYTMFIKNDILENKFFKENISNNINLNKLPCDIKQEYDIMQFSDNTIYLSHSRFTPCNIELLNLLWLQIPVIHNSPILKELDPILEKLYYNSNQISEICSIFKGFSYTYEEWASQTIKSKIIDKWGINLEKWSNFIECSLNISSLEVKKIEKQKEFIIAFIHMWGGFNVDNNFFTDSLRNEIKKQGLDIIIKGVEYSSLIKPSVLIFGPFIEYIQNIPEDIPKVFFSAENIPYPNDSNISLYLGPYRDENEKIIRLPTWMTFIDWFSNSKELPYNCTDNPIRLPIHFATTPHSTPFSERPEFCGFVVSNPMCKMRNESFYVVNEYKKVNSGGELFNNIGGKLSSKYPGGGCGDISKNEFFSKHKFTLSFENSQASGYITEKVLHAKMAGCIPIYWGDIDTETDFVEDSIVNVSNIYSAYDIRNKIIELESDEALCKKIASTPILDNEKLDKAYKVISKISKKILEIGGINIQQVETNQQQVETNQQQVETNQQQVESQKSREIICVSYTNKLFLNSLLMNINTVEKHREIQDIVYIVYFDKEIEEDTIKRITDKYNWITARRLPEDTPDNFSDFWSPEHFGWKLWIYSTISIEESLNGKLILYMDAGVIMTKIPHNYLEKAYNDGICFLEMGGLLNKYWCSSEMCDKMNVTNEELEYNQILAGICAFQAGHSKSIGLFREALEWGKKREVLTGKKLLGILSNGQNYGHRHDQSILSILCIRHRIPIISDNHFVCYISMRRTYLEDKYFYIHRGDFNIHKQVIPKVDDVVVINMESRKDRWESWTKENPILSKIAQRFNAIDGKGLHMTQNIYSLFERNDFNWKKSVMGCALSHIAVWMQLLVENDNINSYLVLEDDMRFTDDWQDIWDILADNVPDDAELLYLGGVLPNNRAILEETLDKVNPYWAKIKPNTLFGSKIPAPMFHFCAYSYIITKAGARKLINWLKNTEEKCFTSIDHYLGHPAIKLNKYVSTPQITKCFQESDPKYVNSEFDNFNRVDTFDSDIWNNTEKFTELQFTKGLNKSPWLALYDAMKGKNNTIYTKKLLGIKYYTQYLQTNNYKDEYNEIINEIYSSDHNNTPKQDNQKKVIYYISEYEKDGKLDIFEKEWLNYIFGGCKFKRLENDLPPRNSWFLVIRSHSQEMNMLFTDFNKNNYPFNVIHISDEFCSDIIEYYKYDMCKKVVRNYVREDCKDLKNVITIPLGYHFKSNTASKCFNERELVWSFHGTEWFNRKEQLEYLQQLTPYNCHLIPEWCHSTSTSEEKYLSALNNSKFCPILRGNNIETFRLYEVLENGAIPIYVRSYNDDEYWKWISGKLSLIELDSWDKAVTLIDYLLKNPEKAEKYRKGLSDKWIIWKDKIKIVVN